MSPADNADLIVDGEIIEREIEGVGTLRFEDLGPGEWLTAKQEPARKARRRYLLNGTREMVSSSAITGTLSKEALVGWAEAKGIHGAVAAMRTGQLDADTLDPVGLVRRLGLGADAARDEAADRGTAIHKAFERLAKTGEPPRISEYPEEWLPWVQGCAMAWLELNPEPEESEQIVCHPELGYAGRPDLIFRSKGQRILGDYKTGRGRVYDQSHYQTRLYAMALEPSLILPVDDIWIIGIGDDGTYQVVKCEATEEDALALLHTYKSRRRVNAGMAAQRKAAKQAVAA